jgi:hypothetical protein
MTRHRTITRVLGSITAAAALVAVASATASAAIIESGTFHDEYSFTIKKFCGVRGLTVDLEGVVDGQFKVNTRSSGKFDYYQEHVSVTNVYTDQATGQTATDIQPNTVGKDQSITDNGDGTLTIEVLLTGGERTYGDDGDLIASNSGQVRFRDIVDAETFELIDSQLIFGSTGTNDDFCEAVLSDWGYL